MTYVFMGLLVTLAVLFDLSVWAWLRANPVPPTISLFDWEVRNQRRDNVLLPVCAATASSAFATLGVTSFYPGAVWPVEDPRSAGGTAGG